MVIIPFDRMIRKSDLVKFVKFFLMFDVNNEVYYLRLLTRKAIFQND